MPLLQQSARLLILFLFFLVSPLALCAQNDGVFTLTADSLQDDKALKLDKVRWKYQAGDDISRADAQLDDSSWEGVIPSSLLADKLPQSGWNGIGWFRLRVQVDESLANQPLSLVMQHSGASEIYIDGKLVQTSGRVAASAADERTYNPRSIPIGMNFAGAGEHLLAIRYSNTGIQKYAALREPLAFQLQLALLNPTIISALQRSNLTRAVFSSLASVCTVLALLHLFLFCLYSRYRANLFYSLFLFAVGGNFLAPNFGIHAGLESGLLFYLTSRLTVTLAGVSFLAYLYWAVENRTPRYILVLLLIGIADDFIPLLETHLNRFYSWIDTTDTALTIVLYAMVLGIIVLLVFRALKRKIDGAWIVGLTAFFFIIIIITVMLGLVLQYIPPAIYNFIIASELFGLFLSNSFFLARQFAHTSKNLEAELHHVKELSAKEVEHERKQAEIIIEREHDKALLNYVEAENQRRAQELEEARQLQLSMLPKSVPQFPDLEIAAFMRTASEVGGDYYDFHVGDDGTLTVVVGDATGHGLKAGSVVTATKSLFNVFAPEPDITHIFKQTSAALKKMNLRGLYMAMAMIKIKNSRMTISAAGMPAALIYRAATKNVEEVSIKAMPLGSVLNFPYKQQELSLSAGDTVVLMSDGFPEMFNERGEILDYGSAKTVLEAIADKSPQEIIGFFVRHADEWAGARPQDDDVTFVVLKVKDKEDSSEVNSLTTAARSLVESSLGAK